MAKSKSQAFQLCATSGTFPWGYSQSLDAFVRADDDRSTTTPRVRIHITGGELVISTYSSPAGDPGQETRIAIPKW